MFQDSLELPSKSKRTGLVQTKRGAILAILAAAFIISPVLLVYSTYGKMPANEGEPGGGIGWLLFFTIPVGFVAFVTGIVIMLVGSIRTIRVSASGKDSDSEIRNSTLKNKSMTAVYWSATTLAFAPVLSYFQGAYTNGGLTAEAKSTLTAASVFVLVAVGASLLFAYQTNRNAIKLRISIINVIVLAVLYFVARGLY